MQARTILRLLATANLVFNTGRSPEELLALADIFAEALEGNDESMVDAAFRLHIKRGRRFPVPAEILDLLCECQPARAALSEPEQAITPGFGGAMGREILSKIRHGGFEEDVEHVCARVMASLEVGLAQ